MKGWALTAIFVAGFIVTLASTVPFGVALAWSQGAPSGLSSDSVSGSIWNGRLENTRIGRIRIGDVDAHLSPFALFTGVSRLSLRSELGAATLVQGRERGIEDAEIAIDLEQLGFAVPMAGSVKLQRATLLFQDDRCNFVEGQISTDVFRRVWSGPELSGRLMCDGKAAVARLAGRTADVDVDIMVRIEADGRYRVQSHVTSSNNGVLIALGLAGFAQNGDGVVRLDEGILGT